VVSLEGVETISQATVLSQQEFRVPEAALPALSGGTYYRHDLIGCKVSMITGSNVGTVVDVRGKSGVNRLVVKPFEGEKTSNGIHVNDNEIEVPLVDQICISIDPQQSMIVIDPPDGLLDLNRRS
jgi:16S rRNA processing protein RimM